MHNAFPEDSIVGEEDADILRTDGDKRGNVWDLVRSAIEDTKALEDELGSVKDVEEMLTLIDRGNHAGGSAGSSY